jgi:hypothetical protein
MLNAFRTHDKKENIELNFRSIDNASKLVAPYPFWLVVSSTAKATRSMSEMRE